MIKELLARVVDGERLGREDARLAMQFIMRGEATPAQIAGFLVALRMRGETVDEIAGFAVAMRGAANPLDLGIPGLVDTCGTGGDGADTFNISTAAALVAAAAGVPIAKHGNRAVSSACGSADVLEALGVTLVADQASLRRSLATAGIAFLFAPSQHPAMKHAVGPRRELGLRTVFNLLGPLANPAGARRQVVGVYDPALVRPLAEVLGHLGAEHTMVVHGAGGMDELSLLGATEVAEWRDDRLRTYSVTPEEVGLTRALAPQLVGGSAADNATIVRSVLAGEPGPRRDIVVLNAGAALHVGGAAETLAQGVEAANSAIDSGAAARTLELLVTVTGGESVP